MGNAQAPTITSILEEDHRVDDDVVRTSEMMSLVIADATHTTSWRRLGGCSFEQ
jgi:hypothetical protein